MLDTKRFTAKRFIKTVWDENGDGPADPVLIDLPRTAALEIIAGAEFLSKSSPSNTVYHTFTMGEVKWPISALKEFSDHPVVESDFHSSRAKIAPAFVVFECTHPRLCDLQSEPVALKEIAQFFEIPVPWLEDVLMGQLRSDAYNLFSNLVMTPDTDGHSIIDELLSIVRDSFRTLPVQSVIQVLETLVDRIVDDSNEFFIDMRQMDSMHEYPSDDACLRVNNLIQRLRSTATPSSN